MKIRKFCFFLVILCYLTEKCVIFLSNNALKKKKNLPCCNAGILTEQFHSSFLPL